MEEEKRTQDEKDFQSLLDNLKPGERINVIEIIEKLESRREYKTAERFAELAKKQLTKEVDYIKAGITDSIAHLWIPIGIILFGGLVCLASISSGGGGQLGGFGFFIFCCIIAFISIIIMAINRDKINLDEIKTQEGWSYYQKRLFEARARRATKTILAALAIHFAGKGIDHLTDKKK